MKVENLDRKQYDKKWTRRSKDESKGKAGKEEKEKFDTRKCI